MNSIRLLELITVFLLGFLFCLACVCFVQFLTNDTDSFPVQTVLNTITTN